MKQCFGYVRVSSLKQGEGISLDAQKDAIERFAANSGITITKWFEEQQTAAKSGRPIFNQMLKALKAGKAAGVVMHKIDRSARNFFDWAKIGELADNGIDVHFATESLDFSSRGGRLTANIQMAVAEDYVRNLRTEIFKGQRGLLERGYYPFSAPIGYRDNGKRQLKTIDPVTGPLVKLAFELYGSGQYSYDTLRHELAKRGFTQSSGKPRSRGCLEAFLANPFYCGVMRIKRTGEVFQGAHEPLISAELFERVQKIKAGKYGKRVTRHNHLFRGLFACGQCGRSMIPERQKGYVYYRCHYSECPKNTVREEPLDVAIGKVLSTVQFTEDVLELINERVAAWVRRHQNSDVTNQKTSTMQLAKIDERIEKLEDAAIDQIIDKATFDKRKEKLLLQRAQIEQEAQKTKQFYQNPRAIEAFLERIKSLAEHYYIAGPSAKREIVEIAVSNRKVTAKNVSAEPSNWLERTKCAVTILTCADGRATSRNSQADDATMGVSRQEACCAHARATSRTFKSEKAVDQAVEELAALARSSEAQKLSAMLTDGYQRASGFLKQGNPP